MLLSAIRSGLRRLVVRTARSELEIMNERIADFRRRGATIGANVRLIGRLDSVNPHLLTIGNSCVIGQQSAITTHCAIPGAYRLSSKTTSG